MTVGQLGKYLWAGPNTLLGLGFALVFRARHWRVVDGALEVSGGGLPDLFGWIGLLFGIGGRSGGAMCLGHCILSPTLASQAGCRRHERIHVRQYEAAGPFYLPLYFAWCWYLSRHGRNPYLNNPFEAEAYQLAQWDNPFEAEAYQLAQWDAVPVAGPPIPHPAADSVWDTEFWEREIPLRTSPAVQHQLDLRSDRTECEDGWCATPTSCRNMGCCLAGPVVDGYGEEVDRG